MVSYLTGNLVGFNNLLISVDRLLYKSSTYTFTLENVFVSSVELFKIVSILVFSVDIAESFDVLLAIIIFSTLLFLSAISFEIAPNCFVSSKPLFRCIRLFGCFLNASASILKLLAVSHSPLVERFKELGYDVHTKSFK
jgi:hypothetical protein